MDKNSERILVSLCDAGLANRMNAIAGAVIISDQTGRKLHVYWPLNRFVGATATSLFDWPHSIVLFSDYNVSDTMRAMLATRNRVKFYNCGVDETATNDWRMVLPHDDEEIVCIKSWYTPAVFPQDSEQTERARVALRMRGLFKPSAPLNSLIEARWKNLSERAAARPVVGVHIRYGDRKPGSFTEWDPKTVDAYSRSTLEDFYKMMDLTLSIRPDTMFYLASYNPDITTQVLAKYGTDRIFTVTPGPGRNTPTGMMSDASELLTLGSFSKFVIGTDWSQFSTVAAEYGKCPFIEASNHHEALKTRIKWWMSKP